MIFRGSSLPDGWLKENSCLSTDVRIDMCRNTEIDLQRFFGGEFSCMNAIVSREVKKSWRRTLGYRPIACLLMPKQVSYFSAVHRRFDEKIEIQCKLHCVTVESYVRVRKKKQIRALYR